MAVLSPHDQGRHLPVMITDVLAALQPRAGEVYVDATFGAGGYTRAILDAAPCKVIALDRDPDAIAGGTPLVAHYGDRLVLVHSTFGALEDVVATQGLAHVNGVVLDVGVSSMQLDQAERGFSFMREGPLDMRMSQSGHSAADVVNRLDPSDLSRIIFILGEEKRSRAIARAIVKARELQPLQSTTDLVRAVEKATGPQRATDRIHPATRTFQALRIFVNAELEQLAQALSAAEHVLADGGRLIVVTFHSLEDRIVKRFFTLRGGHAPAQSRHQPAPVQARAPSFHVPHPRPIEPSERETAHNARARSAKLRYGIRNASPPWPVDAAALDVPAVPLRSRA